MNWAILKGRLQSPSLTLEQFNDILLLSNQRPIGRAFFERFFPTTDGRMPLGEVTSGVANFEGYAMLLFGNVRYAYRKLYQLPKDELESELGDAVRSEAEILEEAKKRPEASQLPRQIPTDHTWLLGYIAKGAADHDIATYHAMATLLGGETEQEFLDKLDDAQRQTYTKRKQALSQSDIWKSRFQDLRDIRQGVDSLQKELLEARRHGWLNTSHYLAADFMDVYVATSMRERWEFEDVNQFVAELRGHSALAPLKLRYFDPTQSHFDYRIDKGLIEGLMLKRARCTVYMVQETDTFGKDSELACTLAQGKPVIAFIPEVEVDSFTQKAQERPLTYLQRRLPQLAAERKVDPSQLGTVYGFLQTLSNFSPNYILASDEERDFVTNNRLDDQLKRVCRVLADSEARLFESRAHTLKKIHPLSVQVHLDTGVANGVLVVRNMEDCARLLYGLLTNTCEFTIERDEREGATVLIEKISGCPFRVLTNNATLTNSFWSWYLT